MRITWWHIPIWAIAPHESLTFSTKHRSRRQPTQSARHQSTGCLPHTIESTFKMRARLRHLYVYTYNLVVLRRAATPRRSKTQRKHRFHTSLNTCLSYPSQLIPFSLSGLEGSDEWSHVVLCGQLGTFIAAVCVACRAAFAVVVHASYKCWCCCCYCSSYCCSSNGVGIDALCSVVA